jgi:hypothetical protein
MVAGKRKGVVDAEVANSLHPSRNAPTLANIESGGPTTRPYRRLLTHFSTLAERDYCDLADRDKKWCCRDRMSLKIKLGAKSANSDTFRVLWKASTSTGLSLNCT